MESLAVSVMKSQPEAYKLHSHQRGESVLSMSTSASTEACEETTLRTVPTFTQKTDLAMPIKNTFVHFDEERPNLWDNCFNEREVHSAPGSVQVAPPDCSGNRDPLEYRSWEAEYQRASDAQSQEEEATPKIVLSLMNALKPSIGSPDFPTLGSAAHQSRKCKPCAFVWKDGGCSTGVDCQFCHLCGPDEKRRRRKAKIAKADLRRSFGRVEM